MLRHTIEGAGREAWRKIVYDAINPRIEDPGWRQKTGQLAEMVISRGRERVGTLLIPNVKNGDAETSCQNVCYLSVCLFWCMLYYAL